MKNKGLTLLEVAVIIVVIGILASLLLPSHDSGHIRSRMIVCGNNLRQLHSIGTIYASTHKGHWPDERGSALWLSFAKTTPPLIEQDHLEMLGCPVRGDWEPGHCDYLGPLKPVSELKPHDALGACKPGNHGEDRSGIVLLKDGSVKEYDYSDPIWSTLAP